MTKITIEGGGELLFYEVKNKCQQKSDELLFFKSCLHLGLLCGVKDLKLKTTNARSSFAGLVKTRFPNMFPAVDATSITPICLHLQTLVKEEDAKEIVKRAYRQLTHERNADILTIEQKLSAGDCLKEHWPDVALIIQDEDLKDDAELLKNCCFFVGVVARVPACSGQPHLVYNS